MVLGADRIVAPTPVEAADLISLYGADPARIRVVAPGQPREVMTTFTVAGYLLPGGESSKSKAKPAGKEDD